MTTSLKGESWETWTYSPPRRRINKHLRVQIETITTKSDPINEHLGGILRSSLTPGAHGTDQQRHSDEKREKKPCSALLTPRYELEKCNVKVSETGREGGEREHLWFTKGFGMELIQFELYAAKQTDDFVNCFTLVQPNGTRHVMRAREQSHAQVGPFKPHVTSPVPRHQQESRGGGGWGRKARAAAVPCSATRPPRLIPTKKKRQKEQRRGEDSIIQRAPWRWSIIRAATTVRFIRVQRIVVEVWGPGPQYIQTSPRKSPPPSPTSFRPEQNIRNRGTEKKIFKEIMN